MIRKDSLAYKITKIAIETCIGLSILVAVCAVGLSWRLSQGPISLEQLKPHIEKALRDVVPQYNMDFENVLIKWQGHEHPLDITVTDMTLKSDEKISFQLHVPTTMVRLDLRELLLGSFSAKSIRLIEPHAIIQKQVSDGSLKKITMRRVDQLFQNSMFQVRDSIKKIMHQAQLEALEVEDGSLTYHDVDLTSVWSVDHIQAIYSGVSQEPLVAAFEAQNHKKIADGVVVTGPMHPIQLSVVKEEGSNHKVRLNVNHGNFNSSAIAKFYPIVEVAKHFHGTASIEVSTLLSLNDDTTATTVTAGFEEGEFLFPTLFEQPVKHQKGYAKVVIGSSLSDIKQAHATLKLRDCLLELKSSIRSTDDGLAIPLHLSVKKLKINQLPNYIPKRYSARAEKWLRTTITQGYLEHADVMVPLNLTDTLKLLVYGSPTVKGKFSDVSLASISGLPVVQQLSGYVAIDENEISVDVHSGKALETLLLSSGRVTLTSLSKDTKAAIDFTVAGSLTDIVGVLKRDPITYESLTDLRAVDPSGNAEIAISLNFPLLSSLQLNQIEYKGRGSTLNAAMSLAHKKKGEIARIQDGKLQVAFSNKKMVVTGTASYEGGMVEIDAEYLTDIKAPHQSRVSISGKAKKNQLPEGFHKVVSLLKPIPYNLIHTSHRSGADDIVIRATAQGSQVKFPLIGSSKSKQTYDFSAHLKAVNSELREIKSFKVSGQGVDVQAAGFFGLGGKKYQIEVLTIPVFKMGRNDFKAVIRQVAHTEWDIDLAGKQVDIAPVLENRVLDSKESEPRPVKKASYDITLNLQKVFFGKANFFDKTVGSVVYKNGSFSMGKVDIMLPGGGSASASLTPYDAVQKFHLTTSSLGELLHGVGVYEHATGGYASVEGERVLDEQGQPSPEGFTGTLTGNNIRVINAPALARILSLTTFVGMVGTLSGKGILFDAVKGKYTFKNGKLGFSDASMKGAGFGIVFKGDMDCYKFTHQIKGSVIPMYAFNTILSKVPLVGKFVSGSKNESGLFAVSFAVDGDKKDFNVKVNPLTAFTPGILQDAMSE